MLRVRVNNSITDPGFILDMSLKILLKASKVRKKITKMSEVEERHSKDANPPNRGQ